MYINIHYIFGSIKEDKKKYMHTFILVFFYYYNLSVRRELKYNHFNKFIANSRDSLSVTHPKIL